MIPGGCLSTRQSARHGVSASSSAYMGANSKLHAAVTLYGTKSRIRSAGQGMHSTSTGYPRLDVQAVGVFFSLVAPRIADWNFIPTI
jgi:hypothetical protein